MTSTTSTADTVNETIPYSETRQGRLWHLSAAQLAQMRDNVYHKYCASALNVHCTQSALLTPREYIFALHDAQLRLKKFCADEKLGIDVNATALQFFRRFFLVHDIVEFDPDEVMAFRNYTNKQQQQKKTATQPPPATTSLQQHQQSATTTDNTTTTTTTVAATAATTTSGQSVLLPHNLPKPCFDFVVDTAHKEYERDVIEACRFSLCVNLPRYALKGLFEQLAVRQLVTGAVLKAADKSAVEYLYKLEQTDAVLLYTPAEVAACAALAALGEEHLTTLKSIVHGDWEHGAELVAEWDAMRKDAELVETVRGKYAALRELVSRADSQSDA